MAEPTSLGTWLRQRRRVLDLTQEELARRVGCATVTLKKIEQDERRPSRAIAERLAQMLELSAEDHAAFVQVARAERPIEHLDAVQVRLAVNTSDLPQPSPRLPAGTVTLLFADIEG